MLFSHLASSCFFWVAKHKNSKSPGLMNDIDVENEFLRQLIKRLKNIIKDMRSM